MPVQLKLSKTRYLQITEALSPDETERLAAELEAAGIDGLSYYERFLNRAFELRAWPFHVAVVAISKPDHLPVTLTVEFATLDQSTHFKLMGF